MIELPGYDFDEFLGSTENSQTFAANRKSDGLRVVAKVYPPAENAAQEAAYRHEYHLLCEIESDRIARPIDIIASGTRLVLVLERFEGQTLPQPTLDLDRAKAVYGELAAVRDALNPAEPVPLALLSSVPRLFAVTRRLVQPALDRAPGHAPDEALR